MKVLYVKGVKDGELGIYVSMSCRTPGTAALTEVHTKLIKSILSLQKNACPSSFCFVLFSFCKFF